MKTQIEIDLHASLKVSLRVLIPVPIFHWRAPLTLTLSFTREKKWKWDLRWETMTKIMISLELFNSLFDHFLLHNAVGTQHT